MIMSQARTRRPGRPGALLRPAPLRTGRARFHASGSGKPCWLAGGQKCQARAFSGVLPVAVSVQEAEFSLAGLAVRLKDDGVAYHCLAGDRQPLFPLARALRRAVGVQEQFSAQWAAAVLGLQEFQAGRVHRTGYSFRRRAAQ
jgi:hypothetical protein